MKIHLVLHQLQLTETIQTFTEDKLAALAHIAPDVQSADVVLAQAGGVNPEKRFTVSVRLALPGKDVHARDTAADLYAAIDGVQSKLARRLRKRKTRFANGRQKLQRAIERLKMWGARGVIEASTI